MSKKIKNNEIQSCDIMNRVFAAKFLNDLYVKDGIDLHEYKPVAPHIAIFNREGYYFTEKDQVNGLKCFFYGVARFDDFDLEELNNSDIPEFFNAGMQEKIEAVSHDFANALRSQKHCDLVFSSLPDANPYNYSCLQDPETNFRSRLICSTDFASGKKQAVWEFYALIMQKLREVERHVIYGTTYKSVDEMTDEEKNKFYNKESESNES